jgi:tetratricopeptide (TPR) repeat protein
MVCWGLADWAQRKQLSKLVLPIAGAVCLIALSAVTYRQIGYWKDNLTLWQHAIEVSHENWMAEEMVGGLLTAAGHKQEGVAHYRIALALAPEEPAANLIVGIDEHTKGNLQEAIVRYKKAIAGIDDPLEQAKAYQNLGVAYRDMGDKAQAMVYLRKSVELRKEASKLSAHASSASTSTP